MLQSKPPRNLSDSHSRKKKSCNIDQVFKSNLRVQITRIAFYNFFQDGGVTSGSHIDLDIDHLTLNPLSIGKKNFSFIFQTETKCILTFEPLPVESNGQILCHADARHCITIHFKRNRKNTEHPKMKTLHRRKHFLLCRKIGKGFTSLPRKAGHPDRACARLRVAEKLQNLTVTIFFDFTYCLIYFYILTFSYQVMLN